MALVKQMDIVTGSIGKLSFYTRKGSDKVYVRTKGGASKEKIKRSPAFELVCRNNKEFGGCSRMSKHIRYCFLDLAHVADYNISSALCAVSKMIQKNDAVGIAGERKIELSKYKTMIQGFEFNRNYRFNSILKLVLNWTINRDLQEASILLPTIVGDFNLYLRGKYPLFRIVASLGIVSDLVLSENKSGYEPTHGDCSREYLKKVTDWYSTQASVPAQQLTLSRVALNKDFAHDDTLVLSIAIEFGTLNALNSPTPIKYAGAGMILGVG